MKKRSIVATQLITVGTVFLAACGSGSSDVADKAGGQSLVLHLASIDRPNDNGQTPGTQAFVDALSKVSGGRLKVELQQPYGEGDPDAEVQLTKAIAEGSVDGGWPSTRAFAGAGIDDLRALEAPLTLTSYDAEKALVTSPVADELMTHLKGTGIVGLGLGVGALRRPFASGNPLLGPADWAGIRFRTYNSPVQQDTVRALGGVPVDVGFNWQSQVVAGALRGAEYDIAGYAENGATTEAGMVTSNVVLWPKLYVFAMSQKRYDTLTDQQRDWVAQAAKLATSASVAGTYDETSVARQLCTQGARFVAATTGEVAAMKKAVAPVIDQLAQDPTSGPLLHEIQQIAADHPSVATPDVPEDCRHGLADESTAPDISSEVSALPDGTYRTEIRLAELEQKGLSNDDGWTGTWTLQVDRGDYQVSCKPLEEPGRDCGNNPAEATVEAGQLMGTGDTVSFVSDPQLLSTLNGCKLPPGDAPGQCGLLDTYTMKWAVDGDQLTFTDADPHNSIWNWLLKPLQKIG
jgi:TRAP-type C4-dicarboxylate transport system substrate-binding protein